MFERATGRVTDSLKQNHEEAVSVTSVRDLPLPKKHFIQPGSHHTKSGPLLQADCHHPQYCLPGKYNSHTSDIQTGYTQRFDSEHFCS